MTHYSFLLQKISKKKFPSKIKSNKPYSFEQESLFIDC